MTTFDRSYLPASDLEFVVIADTHHIVDPGMYSTKGDSVTPEIVREWSARGDLALQYTKALEPAITFHLGDLQQEYPGHITFDAGRRAAVLQLKNAGIPMHHVAGNMDVGDKQDPTMPAGWVRPEYLAVWNEDFGPSYFSSDAGAFHFVVLNSQLLNSSLEERHAQREWLEADLMANAKSRIVMFLHVPPFIVDEDEPGLGSYDVLDQPDRAWLLDLVSRFEVEAMFCGHTHFQTFNRVGAARLYTAPSTTTTRPGFYEAFTIAPPLRGWGDTPKLGLFLVRASSAGLAVHQIRTSGRTVASEGPRPDRDIIVSRVTLEIPQSPLGTYLRLPIARQSDGSIIYPYHVRHRIRDDYPLLACVELGLRHVRFPLHDLAVEQQRVRLEVLRGEGVALTATVLSPGDQEPIGATIPDVDCLEIQTTGAVLPRPHEYAVIERLSGTVALGLAPIVVESIGKVHGRSRTGYRSGELTKLDEELSARGLGVARAVCFIDPVAEPGWRTIRDFGALRLRAVHGLDFVVPLGDDDIANTVEVAEAILATATVPNARLYIDPLQELDREAAIMGGLLDRLSNPRPAFHVVRVLNTILFGVGTEHPGYAAETLELRRHPLALGVSDGSLEHWLLTPTNAADAMAVLADRWGAETQAKWIDLAGGESVTGVSVADLLASLDLDGTTLALVSARMARRHDHE